jgi:hypothetical protein
VVQTHYLTIANPVRRICLRATRAPQGAQINRDFGSRFTRKPARRPDLTEAGGLLTGDVFR